MRLDFQAISTIDFSDEERFVKQFARIFIKKKRKLDIPTEILDSMNDYIERKSELAGLSELFMLFSKWCEASSRPIVLMIDEVDSASSKQVFLDFLALLRLQYLDREDDPDNAAFQSVILAGVNDIRHIKSKIRHDNDLKVNSPWNIAAQFNIDMTLSADGIKGMLDDYESEHSIGFDTKKAADRIYKYTYGYPFLVSRICQIIDSEFVPNKFDSLGDAWTDQGFDEAIKVLLNEKNALFDSLKGKLINYPMLREKLKGILLRGDTLEYLPDDEAQQQLQMFGFVRNEHNTCVIFCRIFEMRLYKQFLGESKYDDLKQLGTSE